MKVIGSLLIACVALAACNDAPPAPDRSPPPLDTAAQPSAKVPDAPAPTQSAALPLTVDAGVYLAGTWEGRYDAKKSVIELPSSVKDKTWIKDDGKGSIGAGTVTLTIAPSGDVSGKAKGALGAATLVGRVDGEMVRVSVMPDDPGAPASMTGVLVAQVKDGALVGELHVAGPDASIVRESAIALKLKQ